MNRLDNLPEKETFLMVYPGFGHTDDGISGYIATLGPELEKTGVKIAVLAGEEGRSLETTYPVFAWSGSWGLTGLGGLDMVVKTCSPSWIHFHYVPQVYAALGFSLAMTLFLLRLKMQSKKILVVFHEVAEPFTNRFWRWPVAVLQRLQFWVFAALADRMLFTAPIHEERLKRACVRTARKALSLPVTSNFRRVPLNTAERAALRSAWGAGERDLAVGFFSRGLHAELGLEPLIESLALLPRENRRGLLILMGTLRDSNPDYAGRLEHLARDREVSLVWTGALKPEAVSQAFQALDAYAALAPVGPSPRSTALMAALQHGLPVISTNPWQMRSWPEFSAAALVADPAIPENLLGALRTLETEAGRRAAKAAESFFETHAAPGVVARRITEACLEVSGA